MMFRDLLIQLLLELSKALLTDELSLRVRRGILDWIATRKTGKSLLRSVHRRVRERLINRLRTEDDTEQ